MIRICVLLYAAILIASGTCQSAELYRPVVIKGVGQFYRTSPGSVAYIPHAVTKEAAEKAVEFRSLEKSGAYEIRSQSSYWFVVNHKTNERPEATYLGVEIITIFPIGTKPQTPVFLKRTDKWFRDNDSEFSGSGPTKKAFESKTIEQFLSHHQDKSELADMDDDFFKWHGSPLESSKNSWSNRLRWQPSVRVDSDEFRNSFSPPIPHNTPMMINGLLIRFDTTNTISLNKPVVFGFNGGEPIAAYVKVFSPDAPEYDKELYLRFD